MIYLVKRLAAAVSTGRAVSRADQIFSAEPPGEGIRRTNFRGQPIDPRGGWSLMVGLLLAAARRRSPHRSAELLAIAASGAAGMVDDLIGDSSARGIKGHFDQLRKFRLTTGMVKLVVLSVSALTSAALIATGRRQAVGGAMAKVWQIGIDGALIASTANLINLLDLRPGRALKASSVCLAALALRRGSGGDLAAAALGGVVAAAPSDLRERTMLGDAGANCLGAALGVSAVQGLSASARFAAAVATTALNIASEKTSFSRVIASHRILHRMDQWGRQPSQPTCGETA